MYIYFHCSDLYNYYNCLEPCVLNAQFQHFIPRFNRIPYFAYTAARGDSGWMQAQRQGDFRDNFMHPISKGSHIPITYLAALLTIGQTLTICPKPWLPFKVIFLFYSSLVIINWSIIILFEKGLYFVQSQSMIYAITSIDTLGVILDTLE